MKIGKGESWVLKYVDFKKFTDEQGAQSVYLFEGEDAYFREKGETILKSRFVQEPTLDFASFDGAALKGEAVAVREMRRHVVCYVRGMRDAAKVRTQVNSILTMEALEETLSAFMLREAAK